MREPNHGRKWLKQRNARSSQRARRSAGVLGFAAVLWLTMVLTAGCGRVVPPGQEMPSTSNSESTATVPQRSTQNPENGQTPTEMPTSAPEPTVPPTPPVAPEVMEGFAGNDFEVPAGSSVTRENWLRFIREEIIRSLPVYSASQRFFEAYDLVVIPSAGSGEWQLTCTLLLAYYEPGARDVFGPWGPEMQQVTMVVLERNGSLSGLDTVFDYQENDMPAMVEAGLRAQYTFWKDQWDRAAGKGIAAIPAVETPIGAKPIVSQPDPFVSPVSGTIIVDMDGDGQEETVTIRYDSEYRVTLTSGETTLQTWYDNPEGAYLIDLDTRDGRKEIALTDYGPSNDDMTTLYAYMDGAFVEVGAVSGILFQGDGLGRISSYARGWQGPLLTWFFQMEYELVEGKVAMMPARWYASSVPVTLLVDLPLYQAADDPAPGSLWPAGVEARIVLSDVSEWFQLQTAGGETGWIRFADGDNLLLPDGTRLPQAGVLGGIVAAD